MKKLSIVLLALMISTSPIQGMERIKALFSLNSCVINKQKVSDTDDECAICKDNYINPTPEQKDSKEALKRAFLGCHTSHNFHKGCILPWLQQNPSCPTCRKAINPEEVKFLHQVFDIKRFKSFIFFTSCLSAAIPFICAEKIFGEPRLEEYNLNVYNSLGSLLHSYATLLIMKKIETVSIMPKDKYPITRANVQNTLMLSASKRLLGISLQKIDNLTGKESPFIASACASALATSCMSTYFCVMPWLLEHKSI